MSYIHEQSMGDAWNKWFHVWGMHECTNRFTTIAINQASFLMRIMCIQSLCQQNESTSNLCKSSPTHSLLRGGLMGRYWISAARTEFRFKIKNKKAPAPPLAVFTLYRTAFAPQRKSYWVELLFTQENGCGGTISATEQSCTKPISKAESHISERSSYYTGQLSVVLRKVSRLSVNTTLLSPCPFKPKRRTERRALFEKRNSVFNAK